GWVLDQSDTGAAVRVVLDRQDDGLDVVALPLEVDLAVHPLVAAAAEPGRDDAVVVPPAGLRERREQRSFRTVLARVGAVREVGHAPAPAAGGGRFVLL